MHLLSFFTEATSSSVAGSTAANMLQLLLSGLGIFGIVKLSKKQYRRQKWFLLKQFFKSKFSKKDKEKGSLLFLFILMLIAGIAILWLLWELGGIFALILGIVGALGLLYLIFQGD